MSDTRLNAVDEHVLAVAAQRLAETFGLGKKYVASQMWPVDDGDTVFAAPFTGETSGTILLAVNTQVAERLRVDDDRFTGGFQQALDVLLDKPAELGEITTSTEQATQIVEIRDHDRVTALFGLLGDPDEDEDVEPEADDDTVEPNAVSGGRISEEERQRAFQMISNGVLDGIDVEVSIELGRTSLPLHRVLDLLPGAVLELGKPVGLPIELRVDNRLFSQGEVVVVGENFGLRINDPLPTA